MSNNTKPVVVDITTGQQHPLTNTVDTITVPGLGTSSEQFGSAANASGTNTVAIGNGATASASDTTAIGKDASASFTQSIALGSGTVTAATNQLVAGSATKPISNVYFGKGASSASPTAYAINGTSASAVATAGGDITVLGGTGNTSGAGGATNLTGGTAGSSGDSGAVFIQTSTPTAGSSGEIRIFTANATGTNKNGGNILIFTGDSTSTSNTPANISVTCGGGHAPGNLGLTAGSQSSGTASTGGSATLTSGGTAGVDGDGGILSLISGAPDPSFTGVGGNIVVTVGSSAGSNKDGADITVTGGTSTGSGDAGIIDFVIGRPLAGGGATTVNTASSAFTISSNNTGTAQLVLTNAVLDTSQTIFAHPTSGQDVPASPSRVAAASAYALATGGNTAGAIMYVAGGQGSKFFTVIDFTGLSGKTVTITVDGVSTVLTEGIQWTAAVSNNATASSLATAIPGVSGVQAFAIGAIAYVQKAGFTQTFTIATNAAGSKMTATQNTDGWVQCSAIKVPNGYISCSQDGATNERFGYNSVAAGLNATAVGNTSQASGSNTVAIGFSSAAGGPDSVAIGSSASADFGGVRTGAVVIGRSAYVSGNYSIALGFQSVCTAANQFNIGDATGFVNDYNFGDGITASTSPHATSFTLASPISAANGAGVNATLKTGASKGSGSGGSLIIQTTFKGSAGGGQNSYGDRLHVTGKTTALSTTTATTTTFALLSTITNSAIGGMVVYTVELNDGTNWGSTSGSYGFSADNNGGTTTVNASTVYGTSVLTGGTFTALAATSAVTTSGTSLALQITPTWVAGTPTTVQISYQIMVNGLSTVTPQ